MIAYRLLLGVTLCGALVGDSPRKPVRNATTQVSAAKVKEAARRTYELATGIVAMRHHLAAEARLETVEWVRRGGKSQKVGGKVSDDTFVTESLTALWTISDDNAIVGLTNTSEQTLRVLWDDAVFVDVQSGSHRVTTGSIRLVNRDGRIPATTLITDSSFTEYIYPADHFEWSGKDWIREHLFTTRDVGERVRWMIPIETNGVVTEYTFTFSIAVPPGAIEPYLKEVERVIANANPDKVKKRPEEFGVAVGNTEADVIARLGQPSSRSTGYFGARAAEYLHYDTIGLRIAVANSDRLVIDVSMDDD